MKKLISIICLLLITATGISHPMPGTLVELSILEKAVRGTATIPFAELQKALGHNQLTDLSAPFVYAYFNKHIRARSGSGLWLTTVKSISLQRDTDSLTGIYSEVVVDFILSPPEAGELRNFNLTYDAVMHELVGHRAVVSIRQDWNNGINADLNPKEIGVIQRNTYTRQVTPLHIHLARGNVWTGFKSMVSLGIKHIQTGTDHLLFILTLLLPAMLLVKDKRWGPYGGLTYSILTLLKIITAFTLGHSITLLASGLGWIKLPFQPVEILIAVSILVSASHAIRPVFPGKENYIALGFGLIHGFAFAGALTDLDLPTGKLALSILGFNIGVEIMQLLVIIVIIPWLIILSRKHYYKWIRIAGGLIAGTAAVAWILLRITGKENIATIGINLLTGNFIWLLAVLPVAAVISLFWHRGQANLNAE